MDAAHVASRLALLCVVQGNAVPLHRFTGGSDESSPNTPTAHFLIGAEFRWPQFVLVRPEGLVVRDKIWRRRIRVLEWG
jgi:hypothetical protein